MMQYLLIPILEKFDLFNNQLFFINLFGTKRQDCKDIHRYYISIGIDSLIEFGGLLH